MKRFNRIVFWQVNPSPHQAPWIRALAELWRDGTVTGVFHSSLSSKRLALGWRMPDYGKARVLVSPGMRTMNDILSEDPRRSVHIFSGGYNGWLNSAIGKAISIGSLVGILSEGRDWRRLSGLFRKWQSLLNERMYRKGVHFVLAMGHLAAQWYRSCGYACDQIYPFCYVVENERTGSCTPLNSSSFALLFVGQLIRRKRVDLLIKSLSVVKPKNWRLRIIGDGKERSSLEKLVERCGLNDSVHFTGVLDNNAVSLELERSDLLILPSRWDGWGAVVNEALMCGVPAICSDFCGAADLIRPRFNGELFRSCSVESLAAVLEEWISLGHLDVRSKERIREWSRCIDGEAVARYFIKIIDYLEGGSSERPEAPWVRVLSLESGCSHTFISSAAF